MNSLKDQILRISRLMEQNENKKVDLQKESEIQIESIDNKYSYYCEQERKKLKDLVDEKFSIFKKQIKTLLFESQENQNKLNLDLILMKKQIKVYFKIIVSLSCLIY